MSKYEKRVYRTVFLDKLKKVVIKEERDARKERIEGHLDIICKATGWSRDKAASEMRAAKAMGINNRTYALAACYDWTKEELEALAFELNQKDKREQDRTDEYIDLIIADCGCDRKAALKMLEGAKEYGITRKQFAENGCAKLNDSELKAFASNIEKRKELEALAKEIDTDDLNDPRIRDLYDTALEMRKKRIKAVIDEYLPDATPEEAYEVARDMDFMSVRYEYFFKEYFLYDFMHKTMEERTSFIANGTRRNYLRKLSTPRGFIICRNKYLSYSHLKDLYKREVIEVKGKKDRDKIIEYAKKHPTFVFKPVDSSFGKGIHKVELSDYASPEALADDLIKEGDFILEELIIPDEKLKSLHPGSVNTIRVTTYLDDDGNVTIQFPFFKIGQKGNFVDNGGQGGILALIDAETGVVITDGIDESFATYKEHPDTGVVLKGFQVPCWEDLKVFAEKAAREFPDVRYAGWDMTLSKDKGWLAVEVNCRTQFYGQQMCDQIGKKKELEELINWKELKDKNTEFDDIWKKIDKF